MTQAVPRKPGRIEVKQVAFDPQQPAFEILHRGHKVASVKVTWQFEGDVDDLDMEVMGEATLTSLQNSRGLAGDIACSLRLDHQMREAEAILAYFLLSPVSGTSVRDRSALTDLFLEEEFLKRIREEGPLALRNYRIQSSLNTLLKRGDKRAGEAIKGVFEALQGYANVVSPPGKRGNVKFKSLGKTVVKRRYRELTEILKIVKGNARGKKRKPDKDDIRALIFDARMKYYEGKGVSLEDLPRDPDDRPLDWSPVSDLLVNDEEYRSVFLTFTWEPDKFAIDIIAKLLGYTFDTMDRYL